MNRLDLAPLFGPPAIQPDPGAVPTRVVTLDAGETAVQMALRAWGHECYGHVAGGRLLPDLWDGPFRLRVTDPHDFDALERVAVRGACDWLSGGWGR